MKTWDKVRVKVSFRQVVLWLGLGQVCRKWMQVYVMSSKWWRQRVCVRASFFHTKEEHFLTLPHRWSWSPLHLTLRESILNTAWRLRDGVSGCYTMTSSKICSPMGLSSRVGVLLTDTSQHTADHIECSCFPDKAATVGLLDGLTCCWESEGRQLKLWTQWSSDEIGLYSNRLYYFS